MNSIQYQRENLDPTTLLQLYQQLLYPRLIEEKMLILLRQGKISKWFSGIGQEAISVGVAAALEADEFIFTMHRNLGVFTTRNMPLDQLFCQWEGKTGGFTKGRDRSFHFGAPEYGVIGMISHLGPQLSLAGGVALAHKLSKEAKVSVAFTGDGATSQGEFHEALNVAAVWGLPVIFVVENNGYGLSTPSRDQFICKQIADRGPGYGMKSLTIDGNNILEVYQTVKQLATEMRSNPHPVLLECMTFRMRGHEEASGIKYVPKELLELWGQRDPIANYEQYLLKEGVLSTAEQESIHQTLKAGINTAIEKALQTGKPVPNTAEELADVYAPFTSTTSIPTSTNLSEKRYVDAISDGLRLAMRKHPNLVLMGQDIAEYGGVFKITDGFFEEFGKERVRNTPLCESAIVGAALGLSLKGYKAMVEMQFADFVTCGFNQIVNNLAKIHYRWAEHADVVIRMPAGGGMAAGPFHSQTNEAWFTHTPGLKVVYPSSAFDAKGLLLAAFEDPNPVMYFEHKGLYRSITEDIPDEYYTIEIGKGRMVSIGDEVSVITYGAGVHWAVATVKELGVKADILDLRSLVPLDYDAIDTTVKKTGRVILLHEDSLFGGIGGEIAAYISEHLFEYLDAPVVRSASLDTPIPFAAILEQNYQPVERFKTQLQKLLNY